MSLVLIFQDSLRRYHVVRFYIQEKEDPHGQSVTSHIIEYLVKLKGLL
jgi:hypothetical protein